MRAMIRPEALELVAAHQRLGDLVAIVTATNEFITRPIADAFGVGDLIAVELQRDAQGRVTGCIRGTPSFREGKIARVDQWLAAQGQRWEAFDRTLFYSDSTNDLPLLERASDPVATHPSPARNAGGMAGFVKCGAPPPTEIRAMTTVPRSRGNRFMLVENLRNRARYR